MKKLKFTAIAFVALFMVANLASCSKTDEEKDAEKLVEYIVNDKLEDHEEFLDDIKDEYFKKGKIDEDFYEALEEAAASEDAILRTLRAL